MNIETERKFLVLDDSFLDSATQSHDIRQGYLAHDGGNTVRVRLQDGRGILTIKGRSRHGFMSRPEWEKEISPEEALELMDLCHGSIIDKTRHVIPAGNGRKWEVDVFHGKNQGLVMAEIELGSPDEAFDKPSWLGEEVTSDKRYYNSYLTRIPYSEW